MKKSILYTSLGGFIVITFLIKIILSFSRYNDGYGTSLEIDEQALVFFVAGVCILIGDDVWIGGNSVINPGVRIGSNVVIGSGSVVTRDIPSGVIAAGNPCRVIRKIDASEEQKWQEKADEFYDDLRKEGINL